jgi:hypothetical protein
MPQTLEALAATVQAAVTAFNDAVAAATGMGIVVRISLSYAPPGLFVEGQPLPVAKSDSVHVTLSYPL